MIHNLHSIYMFSLFNSKKSNFLFFYFFYLLIIGSIFVFSSSVFLSTFYHHSAFVFYKKQCIGIFLSLCIAFFLSLFPWRFFLKNSVYFFLASVFLNMLLFLPGFRYSFHGVARWIYCFGFLFQPGELLKGSFLLYSAYLFTFYFDQIRYLLFYAFFSLLITVFLLYYQSDFGTTIIVLALFSLFLWDFFFRKKILFYFFIFILLIVFFLIILKPYRVVRILTFLNPWQDPLRSGFQIIQSFIAFYRGGLWGVGIGLSTQKNLFLPMCHSDFVFSIIAEEIGIMGALAVLFSLLYFSYFFISLSFDEQSSFKKYYLCGVGLIFFFQTSINVAGVTGLIPLKGIGLPCISYGISSLIGFGFIIGIALSILNSEES